MLDPRLTGAIDALHDLFALADRPEGNGSNAVPDLVAAIVYLLDGAGSVLFDTAMRFKTDVVFTPTLRGALDGLADTASQFEV